MPPFSPASRLIRAAIEVAAIEIVPQPHAEVAPHVEPQPGAGANEIRQQLGQPVGCKILRDPQADNGIAGWTRDDVPRLVREREDAPRIGEEPFPLLSRDRLLAVPLEQRPPERLFEALDLLAHRRLGPVHPFARPGETAGIDNGDEAAQEIEVEHETAIR